MSGEAATRCPGVPPRAALVVWALLGGVLVVLAVLNRGCHAHLYSFPLSWTHAEGFSATRLSTWVGETVQWPYSAFLVASRELAGSYEPGAKLLSLGALLATAWIVGACVARLASTAVAAVAVALCYARYVETALLPSHDGLHGLLACAALAAALLGRQPRPLLAGALLGLSAAVKVSAFAMLPGLVAVILVRGSEPRARATALAVLGFAAGAALVLLPNALVTGAPLYSTQAEITWRNAHELATGAFPTGPAPAGFLDAFRRAPSVMLGWWASRVVSFLPLLALALGRVLLRRDGLSVALALTVAPILLLSPLADDDQRYLYPVAVVESLLWAELVVAVLRGVGPAPLRGLARVAVVGLLGLIAAEAFVSSHGHTRFCRAARACAPALAGDVPTAQIGERLYRTDEPHLTPFPELAPRAWCEADEELARYARVAVDDAYLDGEDGESCAPPPDFELVRRCDYGAGAIEVLRRRAADAARAPHSEPGP